VREGVVDVLHSHAVRERRLGGFARDDGDIERLRLGREGFDDVVANVGAPGLWK
jgi:hypothetical protein